MGVVCTSQNRAIYGHLLECTEKAEVIRGYLSKGKDKYFEGDKVVIELWKRGNSVKNSKV